jgi:hypothetical protein
MTKPKRYKRYSAEFKREAILRAAEEVDAGEMNCMCWETMRFLGKVTVEMRS